MKTLKLSLFLLLLCSTLFLSNCTSDDDNQTTLKETSIINPETGKPSFTIVTDNLVETENGYDFEGTLQTQTEDGEDYDIVVGDISVEVDNEGNIIEISGEGYPNFPDVGNFKTIVRDFEWKKKIKSLVQYKKGAYYKSAYNTNLPLNDNTRYFYFRVLDKENGDPFELRSYTRRNDAIKFNEFYLDPKDPAVFFTIDGEGKNKLLTYEEKLALVRRISLNDWPARPIIDTIAKLADYIEDFSLLPSLEASFGFSNQGNMNSRPYDFVNSEYLEEIYGYSAFESQPAHIYEAIYNAPLIKTGGLLAFDGETYVKFPFNQIGPTGISRVDWGRYLSGFELEDENLSFTGKISANFGEIFGVLPKANEVLGRIAPRDDIFNEDIRLSLAKATMTLDFILDESNEVSNGDWRFGGEVDGLFFADLFEETAADKYFDRSEEFNGFMYLTIEPDFQVPKNERNLVENLKWSQFYQGDFDFRLSPFINVIPFGGYFYIDPDEIAFRGYFEKDFAFGLISRSHEITGTFDAIDGLKFTYLLNQPIELPNGLNLQNTQLEVSYSYNDGVEFTGIVDLGESIVQTRISGQVIFRKSPSDPDFIYIEGCNTYDSISLPDGTEIPYTEICFRSTDNAEEDSILEGLINILEIDNPIPVEGIIGNELYLEGNFQGEVNFKGVNLFTSNGKVVISDTQGVKISGDFILPDGLGTARLEGEYSNDGFELEGSMESSIVIDNHRFTFANSYIKASSRTGVQISGNIDLYAFKTNVTGSINPDRTFLLTGTKNLNTSKLEVEVKTRVTQNGVFLGPNNGCIKLPLNQEACGNLEFIPNWNRQEISVCRGQICVILP